MADYEGNFLSAKCPQRLSKDTLDLVSGFQLKMNGVGYHNPDKSLFKLILLCSWARHLGEPSLIRGVNRFLMRLDRVLKEGW